jgi:hypothetical protein
MLVVPSGSETFNSTEVVVVQVTVRKLWWSLGLEQTVVEFVVVMLNLVVDNAWFFSVGKMKTCVVAPRPSIANLCN